MISVPPTLAALDKEYLGRGAAQRIHLEQFPSDAPELKPAEGIWNYLKRVN